MGDRANIKIVGGDSFPHPLYIYSHWQGSDLPVRLQRALVRADKAKRLDDHQYLGRIICSEVIPAEGDTGWGASTALGDGDDRIITLDLDGERVLIEGGDECWTLHNFIQLSEIPQL